MKTVITYGTFDLFHFGHLEFLRRAKQLGERLIVGVSAGDGCTIPLEHRKAIVAKCAFVDYVFDEQQDHKREDIAEYKADMLVMPDEFAGKLNDLQDVCTVIYLPDTPDVSDHLIKEKIVAPVKQQLADSEKRYGDLNVKFENLRIAKEGNDLIMARMQEELAELKKPKK